MCQYDVIYMKIYRYVICENKIYKVMSKRIVKGISDNDCANDNENL